MARNSPRPVTRQTTRHRLVVLLCVALSLPPCTAAFAGDASAPRYLDRPLIEVLEQLRQGGLNLIFSSAVVPEDLRVTVEPRATEAMDLLEEILAPLGLQSRDGPGNSVLIVRAPRGEGKLRGRVLSSVIGMPVPGAGVALDGDSAAKTTGPDGAFDFRRVPSGSQRLTVTAPGFVDQTVEVVVETGKTVTVDVELEARSAFVTEIVVTPGALSVMREEQATRTTVTGRDALLVPTIGGDISRVVELLPGVAAPDNSAAFNVRGSVAEDVAVVLDGLELYEPFHLRSFQSPFSYIDSDIVERIDFFSGGSTADFGDRHGGLVRMSTSLPGESITTRVQLGTLNSRVALASPLARLPGSWLVSVRGWYPQALRDAIELGEPGMDPRFWDAYFKLSFNLSPRTVLSTHVLAANDRLEFQEPDGNELVTARSKSGYVWVRALQSWTPKLFSESTLSLGRIERDRDGISDPEDETVIVDDRRVIDFFGFRHDMTWQPSDAHLIKAGVQARRLEADYRYRTGPEDDPPAQTMLDLRPGGNSDAAYLAYRARLSANVASEVGLRWDRQTYTDDQQVSPRVNLIWRPGPRSDLRLGYGTFYQSQRIHELRVQDGEVDFLPAELSRQGDLTYQHRMPGGILFRFDAYYKELTRLRPRYENLFNPIELFPETEADREQIVPSRARLRGIEFLLRGDTGKPLHWWAGYALSSAEDVVDGRAVPRSWDQTHAVKFLVGYRIGERWSLSLSGTGHTGWPTTPVFGRVVTQPDGSREIEPERGERNSDRFPSYYRLDGKASRTFEVPRGRLRLDLEVVNLTDRNNVCCVDEFLFEFAPDGSVTGTREIDYWLGITPSFNLLWEF